MNQNRTSLAVVGGLMFCILGAQAVPPLQIPVVKKAPLLDGRLTPAEWVSAAKVEKLYGLDSSTPAPETQFYLMRDNAWLYIGAQCANPNMAHVEQLTYEYDGPVHTDDSIEIFLRPGPDEKAVYYHFLLNYANIGKEQRCNSDGLRDVGWNPPWRSVAAQRDDGWSAEIAIPLYCLEAEDLSGLRINLCRNLTEIILDAYGSKQNEIKKHSMLLPNNHGGFHDFGNFQPLAGLEGFQPEIPFAPQIQAATVAGIQLQGSQYVYEVNVELAPAFPVVGQAVLRVIEVRGNVETEKLSMPIELAGKRQLALSVPAGDFDERQIRIALVNPDDGNLLAAKWIADVSALSVIKQVFAGRNFYTSEDCAEICLELGMPAAMLETSTAAVEVNDRTAVEVKGLLPSMILELPLTNLAMGDNLVNVHINANGKEMAARKLNITRLTPRPGYEVKTDFFRGVLLKDDKLVFPVAIFTHPLGYGIQIRGYEDGEEEMFMFLRDIGFNTLVRQASYTNTAMFMKLADKYGMDVIDWTSPQPPTMSMLDPPRPEDLPLAERLAIHKEWYKTLEPGLIENAKILREHRNMLCYYQVDEPNLINADERIAVADWFWQTITPIDPHRPMCLLYARHIPRGDYWTKWGSILGYDWYPAPFRGDGFYTEPGLASAWFAYELRKRCQQDHKVMFFATGANMVNPGRSPVGMNKAHMLCQTYIVIIYGARGLMYFSLSNVVGTHAWDALRDINAQIKVLAPALLNGNVKQIVRYTPDDFDPDTRKFPMVNAAVFRYPDGDYLMLAANITSYAVDTTFKVAGMERAARMFSDDGKYIEEQKPMELAGETFADKIEPYGVRAYRLKLSGSPAEVDVALNMQALEDQRLHGPDLLNIIRKVMLGKNHIPNPCFKQQTNKGIPDFYRPYFCLSIDPEVGVEGSSWFVDNTELWNGNPSLCMFRRPVNEKGYKTRGTFGVSYVPPSSKPTKMTFSFYGKCERDGGNLLVAWLIDKPKTFQLTTEWKRYQYSGYPPPREPGGYMGGQDCLFVPGAGIKTWISGLQYEEGEEATEFQDDSIIHEKSGVENEVPGNLLRNSGAECGMAEGWTGFENMGRNELGIRSGLGHSGNYAFIWRGQSAGMQSELLAIDPEESYEFQGFFKAVFPEDGSESTPPPAPQEKPDPLSVVYGVIMYDAQKRPIKHWNLFPDKNTITELAAGCSIGDQILYVKDAAGWRTGALHAAAFDLKTNAPNYDVALGVVGVEKDKDVWKIMLSEPAPAAYPAGTSVAETRAGTHGIFQISNLEQDWMEIKGVITPEQWWPGAAYAQVVIGVRGALNKAEVLMDDLVFLKKPTAAHGK